VKRLLLFVGLSGLVTAQVRYEEMLSGPNENWLTYAGDFASQRHSPLDQINRSNVSSLVPVWVYHVENAKKLETTPLVYQGVMYITDTNTVQALDARTGRRVWQYRVEGAKTQRVNRGVALLGDRVFAVTSDAHLLALHRGSGNLLWDREFASVEAGYSSSAAPLVVKDKVLVGVTGGGSGQRGLVAAISAETGQEAWRFWTVPAKGEPGSETWAEFPLEWGGAPTWTTGSFDPALNLVYWPTGNPWPDFYGGGRRGDNLYSDCIVALDADTGKLKWYFQFTPHDTHDWDANETPVLIDAAYEGKTRKLLVQANRNGFYYVLDRTNGAFLQAKRFVEKVNWAKGIDEKGHPIEIPNMEPSVAGKRICPSVRGASNWMSPSYDPKTGLLYVVTLEQCDIYTSSEKEPKPSSGFRGTGGEQIPAEPGQFYLRAFDAPTGRLRWEYKMTGPATMWAGTVSTAGGIVFTGDDDGNLVALDSSTGKDLWHFYTGHPLYASPMTFQVNGRQYVTIAAESDIFTFGLFQLPKK
jgi:alcohol dehydrogenase (cytochrome c)